MSIDKAQAVEVRPFGDGLAVTIRNPPVNALNQEVRRGLDESLRELGGASYVVIRSPGKFFSAGADVTELGGGGIPLRELVRTVESLPCPTIALVEGAALGGGMELALACDYRIATPGASFALPEIKLGLVPGAGGTVRLPRLVGLDVALRWISTGRTVQADEAFAAHAVDAVLGGDHVDEELLAWVKNLGPTRHTSEGVLPPTGAGASADLAELVAQLRLKSPNKRAFDACVELVLANADHSAEECEAREEAVFASLVASPEAAAQRYLFSAGAASRRANRSLPGRSASVSRVGVVGAGTMGLGIARAAVQAGIPATIVEPNNDARERARSLMRAAAEKHPARAGAPSLLDMVTWSETLEDLGDCEVVIEAVFEDLDVKRDVFASLSEVCDAGAVLASNTSYLEIERIAEVVKQPQRVLGMHFFSPAHVMKLVEVVRARATGDDALRTAVDLATRLKKAPVVVRSSHGFVGNRMLSRRSAQADKLLLSGARPDQVDRVLTQFGFPMGPFAMADLAGLDVAWRNRNANGVSAPAADRLVAEERFGQKAGRGFYAYDGRQARPDPEVDRLIAEVADELGIEQRALPDEEVLDRLLLPMVDEAMQIVQEGVVDRTSDVDVIWSNGYGWPVTQGGPVYWAEGRGLDVIVRRLDELAELTADASLRASRALRDRAAGRT